MDRGIPKSIQADPGVVVDILHPADKLRVAPRNQSLFTCVDPLTGWRHADYFRTPWIINPIILQGLTVFGFLVFSRACGCVVVAVVVVWHPFHLTFLSSALQLPPFYSSTSSMSLALSCCAALLFSAFLDWFICSTFIIVSLFYLLV